MIKLNDSAKGILAVAASISGWYIDDQNVLEVAALLERGWVTVKSDYDTIHVYVTDKGIKAARRMKLIVPSDPDDRFSVRGWTRSELGLQLSARP